MCIRKGLQQTRSKTLFVSETAHRAKKDVCAWGLFKGVKRYASVGDGYEHCMYYVFRSTFLYLSNHEAEYWSKSTPTEGHTVQPRRQSNQLFTSR